MALCNNCGSYYRLSAYHNDTEKCEDCSCALPRIVLDEESEQDIYSLLHPSGKTAAVIPED